MSTTVDAWMAGACALLLATFAAPAAAQATPTGTGPPLRVGLRVAAPFVLEDDSGDAYTGLAIEAFDAVAPALGGEVELEPLPLGELIERTSRGELDLALGALSVTAEREGQVDFAHPILSSGLGIAAHTEGRGPLESVLLAVASPAFLRAIGALALLLMGVGLLVWLAERHRNRDQFASGPKGLLDGFWFSAVTMTTVGYGDKAPTTGVGRLVTLVWMFASILLISGFTGAIASSLTVDSLESRIRGADDLQRARVGVVRDSAGQAWARSEGLATVAYADVDAALEALAETTIEAVVHDQPILRYLVRERDTRELTVLSELVVRQDLAFALPPGSELREPVNRALLDYLASEGWRQSRRTWLGD